MTGHDTFETLAVALYESHCRAMRQQFPTTTYASWYGAGLIERRHFRGLAAQMAKENERPHVPAVTT
jgi:hypothetical protein